MNERLEALVYEVCAPDSAKALAPRFSQLINRYRDKIQQPDDEWDPQLPLDETDVFLLVHEDQFFDDATEPATLLQEFLSTQLEGMVRGVHVVSAGASVKDIQQLSREYRLMVDLAPAHAQHAAYDYSDPEVVLGLLEMMLEYLVAGVSAFRLISASRQHKRNDTNHHDVTEHDVTDIHAVARLSRAVLSELAPWSVLATDITEQAHMVPQYAPASLVSEAMLRGSGEPVRCWARSLPGLSPAAAYLNVLPADVLSSVTAPALPALQRARVFLCAQAIMLSLAGVPLVDLHSLIGSETPEGALDRGGVSSDGANGDGGASSGGVNSDGGQRLEFSALVEELKTSGTLRNVIFEGYKALLQARSCEPMFHPNVPQKVLDLNPAVFALLRTTSQNNGEGVLCIYNLSLDPVELMFSPAELGLDIEVGMREIIGGDIVFPSVESSGLVSLEVESYEALWLRTPVHLDTDENQSFLFADDEYPVEAAELEDKED